MPFVKRVVDLLGAVAMLLPAVPLMLLVAVLIRLCLGRPLLFRQVRAGRKGEPFTVLKFRTMREALDQNGEPLPDAARLTRLGGLLRRTSLDELPQLFNVLRGDMSLVGPRPLPVRYIDRYTPEQARRLDVKPGLTGWAQVNGRNGPSWEEKHALDVWYVAHRSLWLDLRILFLTFWRVICGDGISHGDDATMPEFLSRHSNAHQMISAEGPSPFCQNAPKGPTHHSDLSPLPFGTRKEVRQCT